VFNEEAPKKKVWKSGSTKLSLSLANLGHVKGKNSAHHDRMISSPTRGRQIMIFAQVPTNQGGKGEGMSLCDDTLKKKRGQLEGKLTPEVASDERSL
jgi:hypothetical protein